MSNPVLAALGRPFRLGIVGGAPPSMIGPVHRVASMMDQRFTLLAGMLSSRPERSRAEGLAIGLAEARCYGSVEELIANERARDDGIEALAITTPNDSHAPYLKLAMSAGLDVMIEKPLCNEFGEAKALRELAAASGCAVAPIPAIRWCVRCERGFSAARSEPSVWSRSSTSPVALPLPSSLARMRTSAGG
jgi:predicted dehydrogenase